MPDRENIYREIWWRIERTFFSGYMVSERGLQAALYAELREIPRINIVVEPTWEVGDDQQRIPDLVIVEDDQITDIFELKFINPASDSPFEKDIRKLLQYGVKENSYPVELNRFDRFRSWNRNELLVGNACRLHFVAVARHGKNAVRPASVREVVRDLKEKNPELNENPRVLSHWFGQVEDDTDGDDTDENGEVPSNIPRARWSIKFGIR